MKYKLLVFTQDYDAFIRYKKCRDVEDSLGEPTYIYSVEQLGREMATAQAWDVVKFGHYWKNPAWRDNS